MPDEVLVLSTEVQIETEDGLLEIGQCPCEVDERAWKLWFIHRRVGEARERAGAGLRFDEHHNAVQ
jgi:hypothetical protein